jgi:hypothetical protein
MEEWDYPFYKEIGVKSLSSSYRGREGLFINQIGTPIILSSPIISNPNC